MRRADTVSRIPEILRDQESQILAEWLEHQASRRPGGRREDEIRQLAELFLQRLAAAAGSNGNPLDMTGAAWDQVRGALSDFSRGRARDGFTPSETATFILSLKRPLFDAVRRLVGSDADGLAAEVWTATAMLDQLALYSVEVIQKGREEIILRQREEMMELSTPVVELWDGVLALPLIGTLDSARTSVVMENLLQRIVDTGAEIAIIDITGVPMVDTLVAQHLLKTVAAARLMGADCIISGIRPQIAQTLVHLGVALNEVITKATLADAFRVALARTGQEVTRASHSA